MGADIDGMAEWQETLRSLPERAPKEFRQIMRRAGGNIKDDWLARWEAIRSPRTHIPHLLRTGRNGLGYDESEPRPGVFAIEVGVASTNRQAFLAEIIENGSQTSPPHPGGVPALEAETPRMERYALKVAGDLLEEGR